MGNVSLFQQSLNVVLVSSEWRVERVHACFVPCEKCLIET